MAAFCRQVLDCCRLFPLTWARMARETPCLGERKTTTASLLRKLTTASSGGDLEELPCAGSNKYVKEPERRTNLAQCVLEKQRSPVDQGSLELEKVTSSLLDMGFSDAHVNELLSIRPGANPQQLLDIISEFMLLGLNPEPVYAALKKSPQLLKLSIMQMKKRSIYLRKLGLEEGKLKRVLHCCPEVFTMHQRDIDDIVQVLKEKCLFTVQQVTSILHRCPFVLREEPRALEYKFQPCEKMLCCEAAPSPLCSAGKTACGLVQGVVCDGEPRVHCDPPSERRSSGPFVWCGRGPARFPQEDAVPSVWEAPSIPPRPATPQPIPPGPGGLPAALGAHLPPPPTAAGQRALGPISLERVAFVPTPESLIST
ncbi:transcription termination factor 4, mitochondrial isoform X1 [Lemur catta]|uniref:transcription termination factor 4, mitochondrial isoform X1 n=1 Tax=Lemur catta TaxID=9447 RepID=UPI001E266F6B|nr:transcription termination factor 4, mitochondrial isoform X1 [Lemur catta]